MSGDDVVEALVSRLPRAVVTLDEIGATQQAVQAAVAAGLVEYWPERSACVLSGPEASRRGLELWAPAGRARLDVRSMTWRHELPHERAKWADEEPWSTDHLPAPEADQADADELEALLRKEPAAFRRRGHDGWGSLADRAAKGLLRPNHVLEVPGWSPGIEKAPNCRPCECCGGRRLELLEICLACQRSGLDKHLPKVKQLPRSVPRRDDGLKGGVG